MDSPNRFLFSVSTQANQVASICFTPGLWNLSTFILELGLQSNNLPLLHAVTMIPRAASANANSCLLPLQVPAKQSKKNVKTFSADLSYYLLAGYRKSKRMNLQK